MPTALKKKVVVATTDIIVVDKKVLPLVQPFEGKAITNAADMEAAGKSLTKLELIYKDLEADRLKITEPLNASLKEVNGRYKPAKVQLELAIDLLRRKIGTYQTEETRRVAAEAAAIADRVGEGKGHIKVETAARKIDAIEKPVEVVNTGASKMTFREDKVLKITNKLHLLQFVIRENKDDYIIINEKAILADLKAGKDVIGCEIELIQVPINRKF